MTPLIDDVASEALSHPTIPHTKASFGADARPSTHTTGSAVLAVSDSTTGNDRQESLTTWYEAGRTVLEAPDVLALVDQWAQSIGYAGDTQPVKLLVLALMTRVTARPVNVVLTGASGGGKNHAVATALMVYPASAFQRLTGSSPLGVLYDNNLILRHRYLIVDESAGLDHESKGTSILRGMIWPEDNSDGVPKVVYETVKDQKPLRLEKEGPTGLILTTTTTLEPELATRIYHCAIDDSREQTSKILLAQAARAAGDGGTAGDTALRDAFRMAQRWLATHGATQAVIPFATLLAESLDPAQHDLRLRRDFPQLLRLIEASALLHQQTRKRDEQGRPVATLADYRAVYDVVDPAWRATTGVSETLRETVAAVQAVAKASDRYPVPTATLTEVAEHLGVAKSSASERLKRAIGAGYLVNEEERRGLPGAYRVGEPLPAGGGDGLPAPELLERRHATA